MESHIIYEAHQGPWCSANPDANLLGCNVDDEGENGQVNGDQNLSLN
jgi:hypothetical protein